MKYGNNNQCQRMSIIHFKTGGYYGGIKMWCRKLLLQSGQILL